MCYNGWRYVKCVCPVVGPAGRWAGAFFASPLATDYYQLTNWSLENSQKM